MTTRLVTLLLTVLIAHNTTSGELRLPALFQDAMVLQRDQPAQIRGWADAGSRVTVTIARQTKSATADDSGTWSLQPDPLKAGGPHELRVVGNESTITIKDVLVGEVWLCSGQALAMPEHNGEQK